MDFAALPPEINSGRMYAGAGAGPLLAAATAWSALAAELNTAGLAYDSMIDELSSGWTGPSATAMAAAAAPYAQWMHATAGQAEHTAAQARTAAAAYDTAFGMTVPPPMVIANRNQLMALLTTNYLGQNTAAIAATEAQYSEMWAQDAAAMYGYAASSAAATRLTPFAPPPRTTNSAGASNQSGAVGQASATAAGNQANYASAAITQALQGLSTPGSSAAGSSGALTNSIGSAAAMEPGLAASYAALASSLFGTFVIDSAGTFGVDAAGTFGIDLIGVGEIESELLPEMALANAVTPVSAEMGEAATLSGLSVPQTWATAGPTVIQQIGGALPTAAEIAVPAMAASATALPLAAMGAAGLAGRATAGVGRGRGATAPPKATGKSAPKRPRPTVRKPSRPEQPESPVRPLNGPITRISGELRELADLRDSGILTEEEFTQEKRRLLGR
ncbi:PPE family protein, SVP subgroup [[Mycobacterium] nativiensis]|uniref:PPE domain-containing protein n=1 Tax=[Mycobacterium] nativiensis TaxID=2855503 RepID=A0ABU5XWA8_9MYCO|nr:PPE domain-containing protein [Mycolicibacter sp. MYC340]MEB3032203.1 PPE domain-containing protein [Mycolicibacter sp. MYC340]